MISATHPTFGLMLDAGLASKISGIKRSSFDYYTKRADVNKLPFTAYIDPSDPNRLWFEATKVLAYVENLGGFGGIQRVDAPSKELPNTLTPFQRTEKEDNE